MAEKSKKPEAHAATADRVLAKLPKAIRDEAEVVAGGGAYSLLKHRGRTVASVRNKNAKVTFGHDATPTAAEGLAALVAQAVESRPAEEPKDGDEGKKEEAK